jgi:hypothetical protein
MFFKNVPADFQHIIRTEPYEVAIEGGVVQGTKSYAVSNDRLAGWLGGLPEPFGGA